MGSAVNEKKLTLKNRFRGFLPVVIDVETGGFNPKTDALLELAAIIINMDAQGILFPDTTVHFHVTPFPSANIESHALAFNKIDPSHPFRFAVSEQEALTELFNTVTQQLKSTHCQRAVLVGHNPNFDLSFLQAATARCDFKKTPFHRFTTFDTATLGAALLGQTVLAKAVKAAGLPFDPQQAHSALYDAQRTADLFCLLCNRWRT